MKRHLYRALLLASALLWTINGTAQLLARYVDPYIGSEGLGRVFVGPSMPFGMVKPAPDAVVMPNAGWAPMPEKVKGFSQTHVSGTGGGQKYGNILIQPIRKGDRPSSTGLLLPDGTVTPVPVYAYRRKSEKAELGYYACTYDNGIRTEITTAERCAFYRFSGADALLVDVASFLGMDTIPDKRETQQYVDSHIEAVGTHELCGWTTIRGGWNNGGAYTVYFSLQSDNPLQEIPASGANTAISDTGKAKPAQTFVIARLNTKETRIKIGISYISADQARRNIVANDFDRQLAETRNAWERMLAKVAYKGTHKEMRMFYTALYHTLLMPVDKTGENPKWQGGAYYDDFYAIWDTYRTSFPLLMDYYPDRAVDMINALLAIYEHEGYMPDARSGDSNGRTQGGSNAEVVIADAFARGLKGIDYELALQAMIKDAEVAPADDEAEGRGGIAEYNTLGYLPYGIPRAGTRTVEYSYDDWCIAQVARGLGHQELYEKYTARSANWKNLWRADYEWQGMRGFIMPKDAQGRWLDSVPWGKSKVYHPQIPYAPDTKVAPWYLPWWETFFYEALSAEYSLSVPHDIPGLIALCGGREAFRKRLDTFFDNGHYNVDNEPSFLTPYLYHYIGRPDLSEARVSHIINANFSDTPAGLPGNDDSGAMSSWLIWAMMGKYPVCSGVTAPTLPSEGGDGEAGAHYLTFNPVRIADTQQLTAPSVGSVAGSPPLKGAGDGAVVFTLNRQYRTWSVGYRWAGDTLQLTCNGCLYRIPRHVAERAVGFCWDSPQKPGARYRCDGTFLFISKDALNRLLSRHSFVYNGITWREQDRTDSLIHVKADVDNTEMWISLQAELPFVMRMQNNLLGIDWHVASLPSYPSHRRSSL